MPFQVSPGVVVTERDLTTVVPNVATSIGALCGAFRWGPVMERITVTTENDLVRIFGEPKDANGSIKVLESFYSAANYLSYTNNLIIVRNITSSARNACTGAPTPLDSNSNPNFEVAITDKMVVKNTEDYDNDVLGEIPNTGILFIAKYPGALGNSLSVYAIDSAGWDATGLAGEQLRIQNIFKASFDRRPGTSNDVAKANGWDGTTTDVLKVTVASGDYAHGSTISQTRAQTNSDGSVTNTTIEGIVAGKTEGHKATENFIPYRPTSGEFKPSGTVTENGLSVTYSNVTNGTDAKVVTQAVHDEPYTLNNDELHVLVIDEDGIITGEPGEVLERHAFVSKAEDAKKPDGANNYVETVLRNESQWVWMGDINQLTMSAVEATAINDTYTNSNPAGTSSDGIGAKAGSQKEGSVFRSMNHAGNEIVGGSMRQGVDGNDITRGQYFAGYDLFKDPEIVDVTLVLGGAGDTVVGRYIIDNIASTRKDCVALVSPNRASVVNGGLNSQIVAKLVTDNTQLGSSSYAIMDGAWKYQYDRYNDKFIYVPMNGDIGGLCARTDFTHDAWWSPAGYNRGTIKNIVKLSWEPRKADRDEMYQIGINPLITPKGAGVILFGDKTMQVIPSAFDRINVRRLFIVLEKAISIAAKSLLFEFNDEFTRAQFINLVTPFLREVQGRRGITDFKVVCDSSNNTGQVIDTNNFVGDIYIKPARSINFIQLNFIAARTDVSFSEIGG